MVRIIAFTSSQSSEVKDRQEQERKNSVEKSQKEMESYVH